MANSLKTIKLRKLQTGQLTLLDQIYKYRFVTIDLLQTTLRTKNNSGLYQKLETLSKQKYVGKRYKASDRYKRVKAVYYLQPQGLRALQSLPKHEVIDAKFIRSGYQDKTVSDRFTRRTLRFYAVILHLQELYPDLKFFTKREMARFSYFPRPLPDGFISLKPNTTAKPKRYLIDCIYADMPGYAIKGKLSRVIAFFEEGGWEKTKSKLPVIIFLCENGKTEQRVQHLITNYIENFEVDNVTVYTSTELAVTNANKNSLAVWSDVAESDELLTLDSIS